MRWRWLAAGAVALLLAAMANIAGMKGGADFISDESAYNRAELGVLDLARDSVNPAFIPEPFAFGRQDPPHQDLVFSAETYFAAVDDYGSPADSEAEIADEPAGPRALADRVSAAALGAAIVPGKPEDLGGEAPDPVGAATGETTEKGSCLEVSAGDGAPAAVTVEVPDSGLGYEAKSPPKVTIGRFADGEPVPLAATGREGTLSIHPDAASRPWRATFQFTGSGKVCG
jgi:hypothetical protein